MHPRQEFRREFVVSSKKRDTMTISVGFHPLVAVPPIGVNFAAGLDRVLDEGLQGLRRTVRDSAHPDSPDAVAHFFGCHHNQGFPRRRSSTRSAKAAHQRLVDLHVSRQPVAPRPDHCATQLVQPRPRGLIAAQAQYLLQCQGAGTSLRAGDAPHRAKPCRQRGSCVLKDRARRHRRLPAALGTLPQDCAHRPGRRCAAARTAKAVRPPQLDQVRSAGFVGREARFELRQRSWILVHAAGHYPLGSPESSG